MGSPACEAAVADAQKHGRALLKFLSKNDCGTTGTHQYGFLLPKTGEVWKLFTPHPPKKGTNEKNPVSVVWQDGRTTASVVTWYGKETRAEYRLTRFGKDFPFRTSDLVGALLVLVPTKGVEEFHAYVIDLADDIEEVQSQLGVNVIDWAEYRADVGQVEETEDACLERLFRDFSNSVSAMPAVDVLSGKAREFLQTCVKGIAAAPLDERFLRWIETEDRLFRVIERKIWTPEIGRVFASLDDFTKTALSILNSRKTRAGRSFENQMAAALTSASIPHQMRRKVDNTRPDVLIPGEAEYLDSKFPDAKLFMVALKRICRERWKDVLGEAPRIKQKHLMTIQDVSASEIEKMHGYNVELIVPEPFHCHYGKKATVDALVAAGKLSDIGRFVDKVRAALAV